MESLSRAIGDQFGIETVMPVYEESLQLGEPVKAAHLLPHREAPEDARLAARLDALQEEFGRVADLLRAEINRTGTLEEKEAAEERIRSLHRHLQQIMHGQPAELPAGKEAGSDGNRSISQAP